MKAFLLLADAGSVHPDGTFSLLRTGITEFRQPKAGPTKWRACVVACVRASTPEELGKHKARITLSGPSGKVLDAVGEIEVKKGGSANVLIDLDVELPGAGLYEIALHVDEKEYDRLEIKGQVSAPQEQHA